MESLMIKNNAKRMTNNVRFQACWYIYLEHSSFGRWYFFLWFLAPEEPPSNITVIDTTWSTIEVQWFPPPSHSVPGIVRRYNLTYRNLNYSDQDVKTLQFNATVTSRRLENLVGLTLYEIKVTAFTILPGPWSNTLVLTDEGGEWIWNGLYLFTYVKYWWSSNET